MTYEYGRTLQKNYRDILANQEASGGSVPEPQYAATSITNNLTNTFTLTGVGNDDFVSSAGFVPVTGYTGSISHGLAFNANGNIETTVDGDYRADGYLTMFDDVSNNTIAVKFNFNEVSLSSRPVITKLPNGGDHGHISGNGLFYAPAGTVIGVSIASEKDADVTVSNSTVDIMLLRQYTA